jgi:hypothetical protein
LSSLINPMKIVKSLVQVIIFDLNKDGVQDAINLFLMTYSDAQLILATDLRLIYQYNKQV